MALREASKLENAKENKKGPSRSPGLSFMKLLIVK